MLVSILDLFEWNPISRIPHTEYKNLKNIRKEIASRVIRSERFKKINTISKLDIKEIISYSERKCIKPLKVNQHLFLLTW